MAALFAISAGGICCSGFGRRSREQEKNPSIRSPSPDDGVGHWSKIDPKATVRGVVTCAGAGAGRRRDRRREHDAHETNRGLRLRTSSDKSKLVYLTVPSGYEVESTCGFIPRFYCRVTAPTASVEQMQQHDFTPKKVNNDRTL